MMACELLANAGIKGCGTAPEILAKVMTGRALGIDVSQRLELDVHAASLCPHYRLRPALKSKKNQKQILNGFY